MKKLLMFLVLIFALISFATAESVLTITFPANQSLIPSHETGMFRIDASAIMISDNQSESYCTIWTGNYYKPSEVYTNSADYTNNTLYNDTSLYLFQNTLNVIQTYCSDSLNVTKVYTFTTEKTYYGADDIAPAFLDFTIKIILVIGSLILGVFFVIGGFYVMKMTGMVRKK
jgi:hypothetical protein